MQKLFIILCVFFIACSGNKIAEKKKNMEDIMNVDRQFSEMSVKKGYPDAFIAYAAEDVIIMNQNAYPIEGKAAVVEHYSKKKGTKTILTWEPIKADIAASNDIGYTFGNWKMVGKDSTGKELIFEGNYTTIWKKQADGSWKYVLDCGSSFPEKKEEK